MSTLSQICLRTSSCSWRAPLGLLGQVTLHSERRRSAKVTQPGQAGPPHPLAGDNLAQLRVPSTCLAPHTLMTMESSSAEGQVLGMPSPRVPSKVLSGYRSGHPGRLADQLCDPGQDSASMCPAAPRQSPHREAGSCRKRVQQSRPSAAPNQPCLQGF